MTNNNKTQWKSCVQCLPNVSKYYGKRRQWLRRFWVYAAEHAPQPCDLNNWGMLTMFIVLEVLNIAPMVSSCELHVIISDIFSVIIIVQTPRIFNCFFCGIRFTCVLQVTLLIVPSRLRSGNSSRTRCNHRRWSPPNSARITSLMWEISLLHVNRFWTSYLQRSIGHLKNWLLFSCIVSYDQCVTVVVSQSL